MVIIYLQNVHIKQPICANKSKSILCKNSKLLLLEKKYKFQF